MSRALALVVVLILASACGGATEAPSVSPSASRAVATLAAPLTTTAASPTSAPPTATPAAVASTPAPSASATQAAVAPTAPPTSAPPAAASTSPATSAPPTAAPTAAVGTTVHVVLTDTAIKPDPASVPAGAVTFAIVNSGVLPHELIVLMTTIPQDQIPYASGGTKYVQTPGQVGTSSTIAAGASATLTLNLTAGAYVLVCNIESHYKDGMHAAFTVN